jgi:hypothetical protein
VKPISKKKKKTNHRKGLVQWLKVYAFSSSPSTANKNQSHTVKMKFLTKIKPRK